MRYNIIKAEIEAMRAEYHEKSETANAKELAVLSAAIKAKSVDLTLAYCEGADIEGYTDIYALEKRQGVFQMSGVKDGINYKCTASSQKEMVFKWNHQQFDEP